MSKIEPYRIYCDFKRHCVKTLVNSNATSTWWSYNETTGVWEEGIARASLCTSWADWWGWFVKFSTSLFPIPSERKEEIEAWIAGYYSSVSVEYCAKVMNASLVDHEFLQEMNPYPYLIPFRSPGSGGMVYDARTRKVRPIAPADKVTSTCKFSLLPPAHADIDKIKAWVLEFANADPALAKYIRSLSGYCVSGYMFDRGFYKFFGVGKNGKGVYASLMAKLLGEKTSDTPGYYTELSNNFFSKAANDRSSAESASPMAASMKDARVCMISELPGDDKIDSEKLKKIQELDIFYTQV
jgi:hypothetical protein